MSDVFSINETLLIVEEIHLMKSIIFKLNFNKLNLQF